MLDLAARLGPLRFAEARERELPFHSELLAPDLPVELVAVGRDMERDVQRPTIEGAERRTLHAWTGDVVRALPDDVVFVLDGLDLR